MSWFTDIAERAEDLLNRVDKTAATALQNKSKFGSNNDIRDKSAFPIKTFDDSISNFSSRKQSSSLSTSNLTNGGSIKNFSSSSRKTSTNDDEKLLQFLNSDEPLPRTSPTLKRQKISNKDQVESLDPYNNMATKIGDTDVPQNATGPAVNLETSSTLPFTIEPTVSNENGNVSESVPAVEVKDVQIPIDRIIEEQFQKHSDNFEDVSQITNANEQMSLNYEFSPIGKILSPIDYPIEYEILKHELAKVTNRAEYAEVEMKRMQKKLEHWNSQISGNDKLVRELQERERDFKAELDAKNSQLAVLKVRFEEADQEMQNKRIILEELKNEYDRLKSEHLNEITMLCQVRDVLKIKLSEVETELAKSKETYRLTQNEHMLQMSKLEDEQKQLVENVTKYQRKWSELNDRNKELIAQMQNSNRNIENLQQEYSDYKLKAQRILQSKEKLIEELKAGNLPDQEGTGALSSFAVLNTEAEGIKQERDLLQEELQQSNEMIETLRNEMHAIEKLSQTDSESARQHCRNIEEQLRHERSLAEEVQLQNNQLKEEMQFSHDELQHTKSNLQSRIQDRDAEIDKLRKQLTAKSMSTVSQDELESRLHALTENLIQKQTIVEALSTEKNSLALQLERLELQLKEAEQYGSQMHTVVGLSGIDTQRKQKSALLLENPLDSVSTKRIKRMYSTVDTFSIRLGVFFRRYPVARFFLIIYMLLLHLWVMIVLLTYEPEIHNTSDKTIG